MGHCNYEYLWKYHNSQAIPRHTNLNTKIPNTYNDFKSWKCRCCLKAVKSFSVSMQKISSFRDKVILHPNIAWRAKPVWDNAMIHIIIRVPSLNALERHIIKPYRIMHSITINSCEIFLKAISFDVCYGHQ